MSNTVKRILVSIVGIPVIVSLILLGKLYFLFFVGIVSLVATWEINKMLENKNIYMNLKLLYIALIGVILNAYYSFIDYQLFITVMLLLFFISQLFNTAGTPVKNLGAELLSISYIGLFAHSFIMIREIDLINYLNGGLLIFAIFISIWLCDSAAFFIGCRFGKHRLYERISPKKSWEGAIAGFIFTIVGIILIHYIFLDFISLTESVVMGVIIGIFGQIGDLFESMIKRDAGIKDSSNIIPGHGGILDRFDSVIFVTPLLFIYLNYVTI